MHGNTIYEATIILSVTVCFDAIRITSESDKQMVQAVESLLIPDADKEKLFHLNAERLLDL